MTICFVPNCSHYSEQRQCSFFRFPKDEKLRMKWINAVRRKDREPNCNSRICSCHFPNGKKEEGDCPSIFPWNEKKSFAIAFPALPKRKRTRVTEVAESIEVVEEIGPTAEKSTQTIHSMQMESEVMLLSSELKAVKAENNRLRKQGFSFLCIQNDESLIKYYTGISEVAFNIICELISSTDYKYFYGWKPVNLTLQDQVLLTLMKLRLNLGYTDLSVRFNISKHTVGNIVLTFLHLLHEILFQCGMEDIPSQAKNLLSLPNCFANYKNCRIIIDCTEFRCEIPNRLDEQKETYSSYKHSNTLKGLIGIAPNGTITYASKLYPGSSSDKNIVTSCGILKHLKTGDLILADKGFLLKDVLPDGVHINVPPFLTTPQFTPSEVEQTRSIARARIHVERAIRRIKLYRILHFIPKNLYKYSSKVYQLCAALTNYQNPLISEVSHTFTTVPNNATQLSEEVLTEEVG